MYVDGNDNGEQVCLDTSTFVSPESYSRIVRINLHKALPSLVYVDENESSSQQLVIYPIFVLEFGERITPSGASPILRVFMRAINNTTQSTKIGLNSTKMSSLLTHPGVNMLEGDGEWHELSDKEVRV